MIKPTLFLLLLISIAGCASVQRLADEDAVESEARQFMAGYAADLLSHDPDAIAARYSRRGTYVVFPGDWNLQPHDSIASMYHGVWQGPEAFKWHDLSYEVLDNDAVAVETGEMTKKQAENFFNLGMRTQLEVISTAVYGTVFSLLIPIFTRKSKI